MSTIADFNRIEDCDKIDARCVNASIEASLDEANPNLFNLRTSWGDSIVDLTPAVKTAETLTTMYLSPAGSPNCLVYEPERGDNICIHGDDLSRIISMRYLKDVAQVEPTDGVVYMYNETTGLFEPYDLKTTIGNIDAAITNINAAISNLQSRVTTLEETVANHETRLQTIEAKLTPPDGSPADARVLFGNINIYSDFNAAINDSGVVTSLNKNHGVYGHSLSTDIDYDEIFG